MSKDETDSNSAPKRVVRKRAVRRVVTRASTTTRKPRVAKSIDDSPRIASPLRKAPTTVSRPEKGRLVSNKTTIIALVFILVVGGAAWIGSSDSGVIDVNAKIVEKTKVDAEAAAVNNNSNGSDSGNIVVPVQNTPPVATRVSGRGVGTPSTPAPVVESETATTTEEIEATPEDAGVAPEEASVETEPEVVASEEDMAQ